MSCELYPTLLGAEWWALAEPVRRAHALNEEKRGYFRVVHGASWVPRQLARRSRLPRAAAAAETRLRIRREGVMQCWERNFDGELFITRQWAYDGRLVERFGVWEFWFELRVESKALRYVQRGARLCLGTFRLSLPVMCAPLVSALEKSAGPARVQVSVAVTLPLVGLLIAYDGHLDVGGVG